MKVWVVALMMVASSVVAEEPVMPSPQPSPGGRGGKISVDVKSANAFVWRGRVINDEAVLQPSVTYAIDAFSVNLWGSWDITKTDDPPLHSRWDAVADYTMEDDFQVIMIGFGAHLHRDEGSAPAENTCELFAAYTLNGPLMPTITLYYDIGEINALYGTVGFSHSLYIGADHYLDLAARLGAGDAEYVEYWFSLPANETTGSDVFVPEDAAGLDFTVSAGLDLPVWDNVCLTPRIEYMRLMNSELRGALDAADLDASHVILSLTLSAEL